MIFGNPVIYHLEKGDSPKLEKVKIEVSVTAMTRQVDGGEIKKLSTNTLLMYVFLGVSLLAFFGLFFFKNRKLQLLMCGFNFLLMGLIGLVTYYVIYQANALMESPDAKGLHYIVFLPVLMPLLNYLAMRGIFKDEKLVRSMDRLR